MFIIFQLWLNSHPRSAVALLEIGTPGASREIYSEDANEKTQTLLAPGVPTPSRANVLWLSYRNFFGGGGGGNLLLSKFLLLCYCFRTKFQEGAKVSRGQTASGERPLSPLWKKANTSRMRSHHN